MRSLKEQALEAARQDAEVRERMEARAQQEKLAEWAHLGLDYVRMIFDGAFEMTMHGPLRNIPWAGYPRPALLFEIEGMTFAYLRYTDAGQWREVLLFQVHPEIETSGIPIEEWWLPVSGKIALGQALEVQLEWYKDRAAFLAVEAVVAGKPSAKDKLGTKPQWFG